MVNKNMKETFSHLTNGILLDIESTLKATSINPNLVTAIIIVSNPVVMNNNGGKRG